MPVFFEMAQTEVVRWQRHAQPLSVIMMDADHFKQINDRYGHDTGDFVLQNLVSRCQVMLRSNDLLARYGGEEFVIMLPGTDSAGAHELAERIRQEIAGAPMVLNHTQIEITVSLGCATLGEKLDGLEELLKAADIALYRSKQLGRNKSSVYLSMETAAPAYRNELGTASGAANVLPY